MSTRLCGVLLFAVSMAAELCADLMIRAQGLDHVHGINAHSYDAINSIALGIALVMIVFGGGKS